MKRILSILTAIVTLSSCHKVLDIDPISNIGADAFYRNYTEVSNALTGCYNGMQAPLYNEWMMTELRGTNAVQGVMNSTSVQNIALDDLDMYTVNSTHNEVYNYWINTYLNIRAINYVLRSLGTGYDQGTVTMGNGTAVMNEEQKKQLAGEALFMRAYHYFNLTRLFGGVFLITEPVIPRDAKKTPRSSVADMYKFIVADLSAAKNFLAARPYSQMAAADLGRATHWAAEALLAKVYLTMGQKSDALPLLNDVIDNSGHALLPSYADVFSITKEMNAEILFAVRYKAGGVGLGSPFANLFAPTSSGSNVVNNDGNGYDYPSGEAQQMYKYPATATGKDLRKDVTIAVYNNKPYVKKFLSQVTARYDAENDFPVIRYSDVLLMKAEAIGYDGPAGTSVGLINQVRARAGALPYTGSGDFATTFYQYPASGEAAINDADAFKKALLQERRIELAYENQQFFDMVRIGDPVTIMKDHFTAEFPGFYSKTRAGSNLEELKGHVTLERMLLPIPQREIDTNDQQKIPQNQGY